MKTIFSFIVAAFFTTNFAIAMEVGNKPYEKFKNDPKNSCLVSWLPSHIVSSQDLTAQSIFRWCDNDDKARSFLGSTVKVDEPGSFYGTNSSNIDAVRETVLIDINKEFEKGEGRPRVLEVGPGHGFFSESMIIAGAHLTMVEHQKTALNIAVENIRKFMPPFLKEGEKIDDIFKAIHGDISVEGNIAEEEPFQFIVIIDVMHFLTPEQFQVMLAAVTKKLAPGGKIYMSGPSPSTIMQWVAYRKAESNRALFPGYMIIDSHSKKPVTLGNGDTMKPGIIYGGRFRGDTEYTVRNFFSPTTLSQRLSEAGLTVLEAFFRDADNKKIMPDTKIDYSASQLASQKN